MTDAELGKWLREELPRIRKWGEQVIYEDVIYEKEAVAKIGNALTALVALLRDVLAEGSLNYSTEARLRAVLGEGQ